MQIAVFVFTLLNVTYESFITDSWILNGYIVINTVLSSNISMTSYFRV